jgi:transposase InsO family protein
MKPKAIQGILGISRATYYRRKKFLQTGIFKSKRPHKMRQTKFGKNIYDLIFKLRKENPTYGKAKICRLLERDHNVKMSASSVGRILKKLNMPKSAAAPRIKKKRKFEKHAKPWTYKDYKTIKLGERVQIDHLTETKNGLTTKNFSAWERVSKHSHANCYSNATSKIARKFLEELMSVVPYKILSIQVDGGSEFMGEFEEACREFGIELIVLPPAKPKYNGGVERLNGIILTEFYSNPNMLEDSICGTRRELRKFVEKYNNYRPHHGLKLLTPMEYIEKVQEAAVLSHML